MNGTELLPCLFDRLIKEQNKNLLILFRNYIIKEWYKILIILNFPNNAPIVLLLLLLCIFAKTKPLTNKKRKNLKPSVESQNNYEIKFLYNFLILIMFQIKKL